MIALGNSWDTTESILNTPPMIGTTYSFTATDLLSNTLVDIIPGTFKLTVPSTGALGGTITPAWKPLGAPLQS